MSEVVYSPASLVDIERLVDFLIESDPVVAAQTAAILQDAIAMLSRNPLIGRIVEQGLRELVISRGQSGYVALYRFDASRERVHILGLRHQREFG